MSSPGAIVGGFVGAIGGFFMGGPMGAMKGAMIGMSIGGALDPPKGPESFSQGPRLNDLNQQFSTYGAPISRVYGQITLFGNVFWLKDNKLEEVATATTTTIGGKGGPPESTNTNTLFTYFATFAVGLCEGEIIGIKKMWIGSKLVYDPGVTDPEEIIASNRAQDFFTLYTGSENQNVNTLMEGVLGAGNVSAYRGLAYLVFDRLPLADYGNSLAGAQIKVEVIRAFSYTHTKTQSSYPTLSPIVLSSYMVTNTVWDGNIFCGLAYGQGLGDDEYTLSITSTNGVNWSYTDITSIIPAGEPPLLAYGNGVFCCVFNGSSAVSVDGVNWEKTINANLFLNYNICFNGSYFLCISNTKCATSSNGVDWTVYTISLGGRTVDQNTLQFNGNKWFCSMYLAGQNTILSTSSDGINWEFSYMWSTFIVSITYGNGRYVGYKSGSNICGYSLNGTDWTTGVMLPATSTNITTCKHTGSHFIRGVNSYFYYSIDGLVWTLFGTSVGGSFGNSASCWNGNFVLFSCNVLHIFVKIIEDIQSPTLGEVVQREILLSGILHIEDLYGGFYSLPDILPSTINGYKVSNTASIRSSIETLQGAYPFDLIQTGYTLGFIPRGYFPITQYEILEKDLGCRKNNSQPEVSLSIEREMNTILPQRVSISYFDKEREYDVNEQYAERISTDAKNILKLELPLVLTADQAAQKAEILLYMYWKERCVLNFSIPYQLYSNLIPSDFVKIYHDGSSYNIRLVEIEYGTDGIMKCKAKLEAVYTSTASGQAGVSLPKSITRLSGPTICEILDIPYMSENQASAAIPVAMTGSSMAWKGSGLYKTLDAGDSWSGVSYFAKPGSIIGQASNTLDGHPGTQIDTASELVVTLTKGDLFSVTELSMLNGANYFAYGADGRWEIIAAEICVEQTQNVYKLNTFLRGRFGTEWASELHQNGDSIILLNSSSLQLCQSSKNEIGVERIFRAVSFGNEIDDSSDILFTYLGVNLKPYSPVYSFGYINPSTNDWNITWLRRTRIGGEWRDYVETPLSEDQEIYEVEIYQNSDYIAVKRVIQTNTQSAVYTSANQVIDFGSNQTILYIKIYQISSTVGRGYPLTTTLQG